MPRSGAVRHERKGEGNRPNKSGKPSCTDRVLCPNSGNGKVEGKTGRVVSVVQREFSTKAVLPY